MLLGWAWSRPLQQVGRQSAALLCQPQANSWGGSGFGCSPLSLCFCLLQTSGEQEVDVEDVMAHLEVSAGSAVGAGFAFTADEVEGALAQAQAARGADPLLYGCLVRSHGEPSHSACQGCLATSMWLHHQLLHISSTLADMLC